MNVTLLVKATIIGMAALLFPLKASRAQELTHSDTISILTSAISNALTGRLGGGVVGEPPVLCVDVPWGPDISALKAALEDQTGLVVRAAGSCRIATGAVLGGRWVDGETGKEALRVEAEDMTRTQARTVFLKIGVTSVDSLAQHHECEARQALGQWTVNCRTGLIH